MKKINKKLKYLIYIIMLIIICFLISISYLKINSKGINNKNLSFYPYQYFKSINNIDNYFSNRENLIIEEDNTILIGRNEKELRNGYYDIKFNINEDCAFIIINNLQKEDIDFKSISDEYLNELEIFLIVILNEKNINQFMNFIKEEYINLRNNIDCTEDKINFRHVNINKYNITFNIQNNMLKIDIKT